MSDSSSSSESSYIVALLLAVGNIISGNSNSCYIIVSSGRSVSSINISILFYYENLLFLMQTHNFRRRQIFNLTLWRTYFNEELISCMFIISIFYACCNSWNLLFPMLTLSLF